MWVIDEYAIIVRRCDWFIPIIPPRSALLLAIRRMNVGALLISRNDRIINGANFCQVAKIVHDTHDRDVITEGNQKWNGTIPSLSMIAAISRKFRLNIEVDHCVILDINIILDPSAWAIKYLIEASVSWFVFDWIIIGINLNMLISMAIHRKIQFVLDIAIIDLVSRVVVVININGLFKYIIKAWWYDAPNLKLEALVYLIRFS